MNNYSIEKEKKYTGGSTGMKIPSFALVAFMLLLTACPYKSRVAIDAPSVSINKKMVGKWKRSGKNYIHVMKKTAKIYHIVQYNYSTSKKKYSKKNFTGFLSRIGSDTFLNLKDSRGNYYFYKLVNISRSRIVLKEVTNNISEKFNSSAALKRFFKKHKNLSFFFNKGSTSYKRM